MRDPPNIYKCPLWVKRRIRKYCKQCSSEDKLQLRLQTFEAHKLDAEPRANGAWNTIAVAYITLTGPYHMRINSEPLWCYPLLPAAASPLGLYWQDITPFSHRTPSILLVQQPSYTEFPLPQSRCVSCRSVFASRDLSWWLLAAIQTMRCISFIVPRYISVTFDPFATISITIWSLKAIPVAFKNAVRTSQQTLRASVTKPFTAMHLHACNVCLLAYPSHFLWF